MRSLEFLRILQKEKIARLKLLTRAVMLWIIKGSDIKEISLTQQINFEINTLSSEQQILALLKGKLILV